MTFGRVLPILARDRRVIALEEQGHGRSTDRNAPFTFETYAIRHPQRVRKLVFASSFTRRDGAEPQLWEFMEQATFSNMPQPLKDAFLRVNANVGQLRTMHDKDAERMRKFEDVPDDLVRTVKAPTLIVLGDQDIVRLEHGVDLTRLIAGSRLLIVPGGHGDYIGEAVMTQKESRYPELIAGLVQEFLDAP